MQPTVLVTGSNGQLGQELQVIAKDYIQYQFIFTNRNSLDITNELAVNDFFAKHKINYCINAAAYTAVDKAETDQENVMTANALAPLYLAKACTANNATLIHVSTDYVFDGSQQNPYSEADATNPINYYGTSKLVGENNVLQHCDNAIIIRTSWVYSSFGNNFVKTMMRLMNEKESINVINDQIGSPTNAASLANVIMQFITQLNAGKNIKGIYNYSSDTVISWYDFAVEINNIIQSKCVINAIPTTAYPTPAKRSAYSVLNKTKIATDIGIQFNDWKEELRDCIKKMKA
jgi:dTDP-4-dehydrorhamnose reductase